MKKLKELKNFTQEYLRKYSKEFDKITKKCVEFTSIRKEYLDCDNNIDHWELQSHYADYNFLSSLERLEKDKMIFVYAIERYITYIEEIEEMKLNKEYLLRLGFEINDDYFTDTSLPLFPMIKYHIANTDNGKLEILQWHEEMEFGRYWEEGRNYIRQIINDLKLSEYFDFIDYYFCDSYEVSIDFNFLISNNKKQVKNFIKS